MSIKSNFSVGCKQIPFENSREFFVWYPVDSALETFPSTNPWETYQLAPKDSPILEPNVKKAVVLISHGYQGCPQQLAWLVQKLVNQGYLAVGMQHLDQDGINHWQRPRDVQLILDKLIEDPWTSQIVAVENIAIAGFSLGGTTAIWLAGGISNRLDSMTPSAEHVKGEEFAQVSEMAKSLDREKMAQNFRDERIKAAFIMDPAWAWIFDPKSLNEMRIPTYFVASGNNDILVSATNAGFFAQHIQNSTYSLLDRKTGHYIFVSRPTDPLPECLQFLVKDEKEIERLDIQADVAEKAIEFFNQIFSKPQSQVTSTHIPYNN